MCVFFQRKTDILIAQRLVYFLHTQLALAFCTLGHLRIETLSSRTSPWQRSRSYLCRANPPDDCLCVFMSFFRASSCIIQLFSPRWNSAVKFILLFVSLLIEVRNVQLEQTSAWESEQKTQTKAVSICVIWSLKYIQRYFKKYIYQKYVKTIMDTGKPKPRHKWLEAAGPAWRWSAPTKPHSNVNGEARWRLKQTRSLSWGQGYLRSRQSDSYRNGGGNDRLARSSSSSRRGRRGRRREQLVRAELLSPSSCELWCPPVLLWHIRTRV